MVHYGHSCLIPVDRTGIKMLYVFVDIKIDSLHFVETLKHNFGKGSSIAPKIHRFIIVISTGQPQPLFICFRSFHNANNVKYSIKAQIMCLGFEPGTAGLQVQMNPLSYSIPLISCVKQHSHQGKLRRVKWSCLLKKILFYYSNGHVYGLLRRVKPSVLTRLKFRRYAYLCEHVFGKFPNMESCVSLAVSEVQL